VHRPVIPAECAKHIDIPVTHRSRRCRQLDAELQQAERRFIQAGRSPVRGESVGDRFALFCGEPQV
jgi:hypothetical protein